MIYLVVRFLIEYLSRLLSFVSSNSLSTSSSLLPYSPFPNPPTHPPTPQQKQHRKKAPSTVPAASSTSNSKSVPSSEALPTPSVAL